MKIKVHAKSQKIDLKRLTLAQYKLIKSLVNHVRLGDDTPASDAAFELAEDIDVEGADADTLCDYEGVDEINLTATIDPQNSPYEEAVVLVPSPVLVAR